MLLSPIFLAMGAVATSVLNAGGRFAASAIAPIVYNLAIIGAALILAPTFGVEGLAVGVVAGSLGHLLVQLPPLRRIGFRYERQIDRDDPESRRALLLMAPRAFGLGAGQITFVVVTALASTLAVGAVADFNFAFTLLQIPIGVIGVPLGIVLLPSLSRDAAVGRETEFAGLLTRAIRLLLFVMLPIAGLAAVLRREIVDVLFGGGRLGEADLDRIATTLLWFLTGLAAHALIAVLARAFYARQDTLTPVLAAVAAVALNTTLAIALVGPLGLSGIALAIAVAAWMEALVLLVILRLRVAELRLAGPVRVALQAVVGTVIASALAFGTAELVGGAIGPAPAAVPLIAEIALVSGIFGLAYAGVAVVLRIPELGSIVEVMVDLVRRPLRS
jgi:putative peptidoglycan lipid II flippase